VNKPSKQLTINGLPTASIADGHQIMTNDVNGDTNIVFFQVDPFSIRGDEMRGAAVANIRLSFENLKQLRDSLDDSIKNHEKPKTKD